MKTITWACIRWIAILSLAFVLFAFPSPALAFRGGYHEEMIRDCLLQEGFQKNPIQMVQISNINSDIYSDLPGHDRSAREQIPGSRTVVFTDIYVAAPQYLHFGNLTGYDAIAAEWDRIATNTYYAVKQAESAGDPEGLLAALGTSSHVVQDFYAHSNWPLLDWGGDAAWFDIPEEAKRNTELYTFNWSIEAHNHDNINNDYAGRPQFQQSYREAYYASCQWVRLVKSWVSPGFWDAARTYEAYNFAEDEKETRQLVWYSGTWKEPPVQGPGWEGCAFSGQCEWDGSGEDVGYALASWLNGDRLSRKWEPYAMMIASPLKTGVTLPHSQFEFIPRHVWVTVDTNQVKQLDPWYEPEDIDIGDQADFYAKIWATGLTPGQNQTIDPEADRLYIETMYEGHDDLRPNWLTMIPYQPPTAESDFLGFRFRVMDDDGIGATLRGADDHCDADPREGIRDKSVGFFALSPTFSPNSPLVVESRGTDHDDDEVLLHMTVTYTTPDRIAQPSQMGSLSVGTLVRPPIDTLPDKEILGRVDLNPPSGFVDFMNCKEIAGWAWDPKTPNQPIQVEIYDVSGGGERLLTSILADAPRADLVSALGDNGKHGFHVQDPSFLSNGQPHQLRFDAVNSNPNFVNVALQASSPSVSFALECKQAPSKPVITAAPQTSAPDLASTAVSVSTVSPQLAPTASPKVQPGTRLPCSGATLALLFAAALWLGRKRRL